MSTCVEELIEAALQYDRDVQFCQTRAEQAWCSYCKRDSLRARNLARTALLATLRKQHLRLAYFAPDAERASLRKRLRITLDRTT